MKQSMFITIFITTHIAFIFLQIYKHMEFIKQSFRKQKNEQLYDDTLQKKQELMNKLYAIKSHAAIKEFAQNILHMKSIRLNQIKRLKNDNRQV